jgi:hypothetical protein
VQTARAIEKPGSRDTPVSNCTILPSNTSTRRQIIEHADFRE